MTFSTKTRSICTRQSYWTRPFRDPAFHETTVILVPLGPSVFKNIILSMMIGYFSVFSAFRCAMSYMSFCIRFVEKTSVNAQPFSPLIFEKIAPDFKNKVFSYFASLRLRFLYLFIFSLIFGCPFPPPWPRLVSFVIDFDPIFKDCWSTCGHFCQDPKRGGGGDRPQASFNE